MLDAVTRVRVHVEGGGNFECQPGDNLLHAALREGLGFPYECNSGGCGSCQFAILEGEVRNQWEQAPGLSPRARVRGQRLACQSVIKGDCRIKVGCKPEFVPLTAPVAHTAELVARNALTADMAEYTFKCAEAAEFAPGQYALLRLPGVVGDRAYSMSNLPNPDGLWSFIIKRTPNGRGTSVLAEIMCIGDRVELNGPFGMAYLRSTAPRDLVCIGGGSGLSPLKAIISAAVREPELADRKIFLFYGGRNEADICTHLLLEEDPHLLGRVTVIPAISEPERSSTWKGEQGLIHEVAGRWLEEQASPANRFEYYFCGPPPMTDAVQRLLMLDRRVPMAQLHFDRFL